MLHVTRSKNSVNFQKNSKNFGKLLKLQIEIFIELAQKHVNIILRHIKSEDSHWARREMFFRPEVPTGS